MKKLIIALLIATLALAATTAPASAATTDKGLVKAYCMKTYKKAPKYVKEGSAQVKHHKGKMIVEVVKTKSCGKYGKTRDGYKIKYNKTVKKGQTVNVYLVYNPRNNAPDDITAVICNKKIRK